MTYLEAIIDVEEIVGVHAGIQHQLFRKGPHPPVSQLILLISLHNQTATSATTTLITLVQ